MKNEGWTYSELAGELWARGINIDQVPDVCIASSLNYRHPEQAAEFIAANLGYSEPKP